MIKEMEEIRDMLEGTWPEGSQERHIAHKSAQAMIRIARKYKYG